MLRTTIRTGLIGLVAGLALAIATPAWAQKGTLKGSVVNAGGDGVAQVRVTFVHVDDPNKKASALTDRFGDFFRNNLDPGLWNLEAERFSQVARFHRVTVKAGETRQIAPMVLGDRTAPPQVESPESAMDTAEIEKRNARLQELQVLFAQAEAATTKGDYADALAKLTEVAGEIEKCAACYARMGDVYRRQNDLEAAEKAFKQAIEFDPSLPDPYSLLAIIYNEMKRYEEAAAMGAKAAELTGGGEGGGAAAYNQGVIFWNQNKIAEAAEQFDRARKSDPKLAEAHFRYALAMFNLGRLPDAKEPLEAYLKLQPDGEHAAEAKALLAAIK